MLIRQTLKKYPIFKVCQLCKIAKVSYSGYFAWISRQNINRNKDTEILKLIAKIFYKHNRKVGFRRIKMELEKDYQMLVNHKKIIRIKKEYGLKTKVRTTNQHKTSFEKVRKWCIAENILNRNFNQKLPERAYATDVTYLKLNDGVTYYLSAIKDLGSKEISAYEVSENHDTELILNTLKRLERDEAKTAIMHSDQGGIYTSFEYMKRLKDMNLTRSMSRSGECLDNASIETFFGHLKDEIDYKKCKNIKELRDKIEKYVYYYNNGRYQWNLKRMTPKEYRHFLKKSYRATPF